MKGAREKKRKCGLKRENVIENMSEWAREEREQAREKRRAMRD